MPEISIYPEEFHLWGINIGLSVVIAWAVIAVLVVVLLFIRYKISRFTASPGRFQSVIELIVDGMYRFARGKVGHAADFAAPIALTLMVYVFCTTVVELFGIPPATEDINCTFALGLCSFFMVNTAGLKYKGFRGRIHSLAMPTPIVFPIRVMTEVIAPVSMGIRLFANVMLGGVIMKLIYAVIPVIIPAALASYFNLLHVGIQTFVFGLLCLTYMSEAVE